MLTFVTPDDVRSWSEGRRATGDTVALVPTMGALHVGHLALIDLARRRSDAVVVSVFVNPLQFDRSTDFESYPRPIDDDLAASERAGVDAVYAPTAATMYPAGSATTVVVAGLSEPMEGAMRPGHFHGVTTVVTKLFAAVRPNVAVFGEKDFQQLAIVRRMAADLDLGVEIVGHPIVRESDGLALSSRNTRLTPEQRRAARCIPRALDTAVDLAAPNRDTHPIIAAAEEVLDAEPHARREYVSVFEPHTLAPLDRVTPSARIATAVWIGDVRLIDNRPLLDG